MLKAALIFMSILSLQSARTMEGVTGMENSLWTLTTVTGARALPLGSQPVPLCRVFNNDKNATINNIKCLLKMIFFDCGHLM
jgi:hypothetical protein